MVCLRLNRCRFPIFKQLIRNETLERTERSLQEEGGSTERSSDLFGLKMTTAFTKAFFYTDSLLRRGQDPEAYSTVRWSGCGATCLMVRELDDPVARGNTAELAKLYVANVGASHALLVRNNRHFRLTQSHTPGRRKERKRVQERVSEGWEKPRPWGQWWRFL